MIVPLVRVLGRGFSPGGRHGRLSVLIYHQILAEPDSLRPDALEVRRFVWQMEALASCFTVLPLAEAIERLSNGDLPPRAVCITFDDGYADNVQVALPVLERIGLPATFFIATGYLDGGMMWNDEIIEAVRAAPAPTLDLRDIGFNLLPVTNIGERLRAVTMLIDRLKYLSAEERAHGVAAVVAGAAGTAPDGLMMCSEDVRHLVSRGMAVGAHTHTHPILRNLSLKQASREIGESRARLAEITGSPVKFFAFPNGKPGGDYDARHVVLLREMGFTACFSTAWGVATRACDRMQIPRFTPWDATPARFALRLLYNCMRTRPQVARMENSTIG